MGKLEFDGRGNLVAGEIQEIGFNEFSAAFAESFDADSNRLELTARFEKYLNELTQFTRFSFFIWVNGSFVSKKPNPADIDFIVFLDYRDYEANEKLIDGRFSSKHARTIFGVDAYVVCEFPASHPKHVFTISDHTYWLHLFSTTKASRAKPKFSKGFVQLNFKENE